LGTSAAISSCEFLSAVFLSYAFFYTSFLRAVVIQVSGIMDKMSTKKMLVAVCFYVILSIEFYQMKAEIITIGDEILIGQIIDTNSSWLGQELGRLGISVVHRTSVGDDSRHILQALGDARNRADIILITGGLGPTKDDITKSTLCEYFQAKLILNEKVLEWVSQIFARRKLPMIESNKSQAMVPSNCEVLFNRSGTAPGMWFDADAKIFISMPGVPFEMKTIFTEEVVPRLKQRFSLPVIIHRTIQTCSIGESFLAKRIEVWENALPPYIKLAYLPNVGQVRLRLSGYGDDREKLHDEIEVQVKKLYELIGSYIYGEGDDTLQQVVGTLLRERKKTLATAESCTGGYIAHLLTSVPGSSAYYTGSVISYANEIKIHELGVSEHMLKTEGAVSEVCIKQMASGIRKKFNTDYAIATSGIAGPDGGTAAKPVGTVWIAVSSKDETTAHLYNMGDNRERTIQRSAIEALDLLRRKVVATPVEE
jgi:nicotinamide-nucleotide amidase